MDKSCEWVLGDTDPALFCLMPEYIGKKISDVLPLWDIPSTAVMYNWYEVIDIHTEITYGMRIHSCLPLIHDPKKQRHITLENNVSKKP